MKFGVSVYDDELRIPLIFRSISVSIQAIVSLKFDTVVLELVQMFTVKIK